MKLGKFSRTIAKITALMLIFTVFAAFAGIGDTAVYGASETTVNATGTVTDGPLNVRSGPGTGYSKLGKLAKGKTITVLTKQTNSKGETWYKFKYSSSKNGYISAKYVKLKASDKVTSFERKATVKAGPLNVRSGSGTSYSKLGSLKKGTVIYIKKKVTKSSGAVWYQFTYNGKTGYVNSKYITLTSIVSETAIKNTATILDGPLNVRSGPGTSYSKLGTIAKGKTIQTVAKIKKTDGSVWYKYKFSSSKYGYVSSTYVKLADTKTESQTQAASETAVNKEATVTEILNVRSKPDQNSDLLGKVQKGTVITVLTKVTNADGSNWYKYKFSTSQYGYLSADYVQIGVGVASKIGTVTTDSGATLNVRSGAGTEYSRIGSLASGDIVTVTDSKKASNGKVWYEFQYTSSKEGWVCSDYMSTQTITSTPEFENYMDEQGFPESYKPALRALNYEHPEWVFKAYNVGCSWATAVAKENAKPGINVVSSSSPKSYRSKDSDCYNSKTGVWSRYDGTWYSAHTDVIEYYMDPRNFLNETGIYQFLTHKYDSATQNTDTVAAVIDGTFMETKKPAGETSYASLINKAGKNSGVSPNVLAAMIIQEQGVKGTSGSISGKVKNYEGYYNYLNVGAWTTSTMSAVERGLWYAKQKGWNTPYKSVLGGAKTYYNNYIERNQYTFYTKKFNVMNGTSQIGVHQYMTNVQGAYGEGLQLKKAFPDNYNKALTFIIPVYDSMPSSPCKLP